MPQVLMTGSAFSRHVNNGRRPFIPTLPNNFLLRPEALSQLRTMLLDPSSSSTLVLSSQNGLGGMGKTLMALALAEDSMVMAAFPDGILWASLGQAPDRLELLVQWLRILGSPELHTPTIALASKHLRYLIRRRRLLLVVDGVVALEDLAPFQVVEDTACRLLVTTRDVTVPQSQTYALQTMTASQALQFFTAQLEQPLGAKQKKDALQFAKAVGYLPLSLNLGVAQVKIGLSWEELLINVDPSVNPTDSSLSDLDEPNVDSTQDPAPPLSETAAESAPHSQKPGLSLANIQSLWKADDSRDHQHQARQNCLQLCLMQLAPELRFRFAALGLFPCNVAITPQMAGTVWALTEAEALHHLQILERQGCLSAGNSRPELSFCLSSVMRDMARWLLNRSQDATIMSGVGLSWSGAQRQFLERYRPLLPDGQWYNLPPDPYIYPQLFWHLEQAGWHGEIHQQLQASSAVGRHAWYDACDRLELHEHFTADLGRAWRLAQQIYQAAPEHSIGLQVRYALTTAFARQHPAQEVLAVDETQRPYLSERLREDRAHTKVLIQAARYLPDLALDVLLATVNSASPAAAQTIFELLSTVHQDSPKLALELTTYLSATPTEVDALIRLVPEHSTFCLPLLTRLHQTVDDARLVAGIACLAQASGHSFHPELYSLLQTVDHPLDRLLLLDQLHERLPEFLQKSSGALRQDCLEALSAQREGLGRLPLDYGPALTEIDSATEAFLDCHQAQGWAVALYFVKYPALMIEQAHRRSVSIRSEEKRSITQAFLVPRLADYQRREVWRNSGQFSDPECRARVLVRLVPFLPEAIRPLLATLRLFETPKKLEAMMLCLPAPAALEPEIYATISALRTVQDVLPYLRQVMSYQPQGLVAMLPDIPFDPDCMCEILRTLAPVPPAIGAAVLERVEGIPPVYERATALGQIGPLLPQPTQSEALAAARRIQFPYARVVALAGFIPAFPEMVPEAMAALKSCHADSPDDLYEALIPVLPDEERAEVIALIFTIADLSSRLERLIRALPYQPSLIDEIKRLMNANPDLQTEWEFGRILDALHRACEANLSRVGPQWPRTTALILAMLPLLDWQYSPFHVCEDSDFDFCDLINAYLDRQTQSLDELDSSDEPLEAAIAPRTISQCLDFF
ncbi:MAG: NB-ARC domain-containing protein, partial [Pseudomonadota bacterium]